MNLQPLYDVKERLEHAAIAGTGLIPEDFRLRRAADNLKPLAQASPVFAKLSAGVEKLLSAPPEERGGQLLDVLALADAVAYTQGSTGMAGELAALPTGGGTYAQISYGQIQPLLTALTTTGSGRVETAKSAWEVHPAYFTDFRVLPALIAGLGDSYGEMAEQNARILKELGPVVLPLLKRDFDPAGKRDMARRVEVIAAIEGADAMPWLHDILPEARKDVRAEVIRALGADPENTGLLLDLAKSERGKNREAALQALAFLDGEAVRDFWAEELEKNSESAVFLGPTSADWASDLIAAGFRRRMEHFLTEEKAALSKDNEAEFQRWCSVACGKSSPAMLEFWRWADGHLPAIAALLDCLLDGVCRSGPGPLCDLSRELWKKHPKEARYLPHAFLSAALTRPAAEVFDEFSPYIPTKKPLLDAVNKHSQNDALLRALARVHWHSESGRYEIFRNSRDPVAIDSRWIPLLISAHWKAPSGGDSQVMYFSGGGTICGFDSTLLKLVDPDQSDQCALIVPYLRQRLTETGNWYSYARLLPRFHGSPKGLLKPAVAKKPQQSYFYYIWELCADLAKTLPPEETADVLEELYQGGAIRKNDLALANKAVPYTLAVLRAGKPLPEWDEVWRMR